MARLYIPPIGTLGARCPPSEKKKGSRTQSTTSHKNGNDTSGYITTPLYTLDSEDGITTFICIDGITTPLYTLDSEDGITTPLYTLDSEDGIATPLYT